MTTPLTLFFWEQMVLTCVLLLLFTSYVVHVCGLCQADCMSHSTDMRRFSLDKAQYVHRLEDKLEEASYNAECDRLFLSSEGQHVVQYDALLYLHSLPGETMLQFPMGFAGLVHSWLPVEWGNFTGGSIATQSDVPPVSLDWELYDYSAIHLNSKWVRDAGGNVTFNPCGVASSCSGSLCLSDVSFGDLDTLAVSAYPHEYAPFYGVTMTMQGDSCPSNPSIRASSVVHIVPNITDTILNAEWVTRVASSALSGDQCTMTLTLYSAYAIPNQMCAISNCTESAVANKIRPEASFWWLDRTLYRGTPESQLIFNYFWLGFDVVAFCVLGFLYVFVSSDHKALQHRLAVIFLLVYLVCHITMFSIDIAFIGHIPTSAMIFMDAFLWHLGVASFISGGTLIPFIWVSVRYHLWNKKVNLKSFTIFTLPAMYIAVSLAPGILFFVQGIRFGYAVLYPHGGQIGVTIGVSGLIQCVVANGALGTIAIACAYYMWKVTHNLKSMGVATNKQRGSIDDVVMRLVIYQSIVTSLVCLTVPITLSGYGFTTYSQNISGVGGSWWILHSIFVGEQLAVMWYLFRIEFTVKTIKQKWNTWTADTDQTGSASYGAEEGKSVSSRGSYRLSQKADTIGNSEAPTRLEAEFEASSTLTSTLV